MSFIKLVASGLLTVAAFLSLTATAQQSHTKDTISLRVYETAMKSGDYATAVQALNRIIAVDSRSPYRDTLAVLYFDLQQPAQSLYWSEELLRESDRPVSVHLLEMKARSLTALGKSQEAAATWKAILSRDSVQPMYWWELAKVQYSLQQRTETLATLSKLSLLPADTASRLPYAVSKEPLAYTTIPAAAANLEGVLRFELKQYTESENCFNKALEIDPAYREAALNLAALKAELAKDKAPVTQSRTKDKQAGSKKPG
jgi:tetratricopeptide (TPR) repeat protein